MFPTYGTVPVSYAPLIDKEMTLRRVVVLKQDVVYVRGIFEASDGVAAVFSEQGGDLTFAAMPSRAAEMDALLEDIKSELGSTMLIASDLG